MFERSEHPTQATRTIGQRVVERIARNSVPPATPDLTEQHAMMVIVDPQVPERDRDLLRYADHDRLAHTRTRPLDALRRPRVYAPRLPYLNDRDRQDAERSMSRALSMATTSTLISLALVALPHITDVLPEGVPLGVIIAVAGAGWFIAAGYALVFTARTGARLRSPLDPIDAAAHRHPGRFLVPQDFDEDGRSLVAEADWMVDNAQVHERIPDQIPVLEDHVWRIAEAAAAHAQARGQGADEEVLAQSRSALERHVSELRGYIDQALDNAPETGALDTGQGATEASNELRARLEGTEASIRELTDPGERP